MKEIEQYINLVFEKYGWSEARYFQRQIINYAEQLYKSLKKEKEFELLKEVLEDE